MFKEAIKPLAISMLILPLISCGGKSQSAVEAESLLEQAGQACDSGDTGLAMHLLDSLADNYGNEIEVQRLALNLRPRVIEAETLKEISTVDSLMTAYAAEHERLEPQMKKITDKKLVEPYFVPVSGYDAGFLNSTGIQPRVDEIGQFYMLSSVNGANLKHESVTLQSSAGEVSTPQVPFDGELNYRIGASELVTYMPEQCDTLGQFVFDNPSLQVSVVFNGSGGKKKTVRLTQAQTRGIADAYRFSKSILASRELAVKRQKLERRLQVARDQIARTAPGDQS